MASITRKPNPPPFPVGAKLVCVGNRSHVYAPAVKSPREIEKHPEDWIRISGTGIEVVITEVKLGSQGTGRQLVDSDGPMFYDTAESEPILHSTKDGYSVYYVVIAEQRHGRIIHYADRKDWKVMK